MSTEHTRVTYRLLFSKFNLELLLYIFPVHIFHMFSNDYILERQ